LIQPAVANCLQVMVPMRDGVRLNTFVYLPTGPGESFPVILQRSPYGIVAAGTADVTDPTAGWLPDPARPLYGPILRGWRALVDHGYAAVYQDCRGRFGSEGIDRVYRDDAEDGYDTVDWIASQPWCNGQIGLSGSSACGTTTMATASQGHPNVRAFFAQVGASSIYEDVVYEGQALEIERLWLWVASNIAGLSATHRSAVMQSAGLTDADWERVTRSAAAHQQAMVEAAAAIPPFVDSPEWMHLPLAEYPDFSVVQPFLGELLRHPAPDAFRSDHNFRRSINIPGFYVTSWYDIFAEGTIAAFQEIQSRVGNQHLWIGPNDHGFVYESQFWPRDPYFDWFDRWLKDERLDPGPPVLYSPRAWVEPADYTADDWLPADAWPPRTVSPWRLHLGADGTLNEESRHSKQSATRTFTYDPRLPVPSHGGRAMMIARGMLDQRDVPTQTHGDYGLIYQGPVLTGDLTITGNATVTISAESDCPDTDFIAKLIEVHPDGTASLLMDGVTRAMYRDAASSPEPARLIPGRVVQVRIALGQFCHTLASGSRLRVDITSSDFPRRARNTNSGHPVLADDRDSDIRVATTTVHHSRRHPSYIEIDTMPRSHAPAATGSPAP
jgi:putative CocE/NonD family hydrolase